MAFHEGAAAVESIVTTLALLVGGVWALWLFRSKREPYPRARLSHTLTVLELDAQRRIVRVDLKIENVGSQLLQIDSLTSRLQQVLPLVEIDGAPFTPNPTNSDPEVPWPMLRNYQHSFATGHREIEPGETDSFQFDYIIPRAVTVVQAYSYVANAAKRRKGPRYDQVKEIGWNLTDIHRLG